jgi:glycosyltransferase involved in cell wall biosynthesis
MRIAFVDLVFSWPPPGGAQADLFYTAREMQNLGHEVCLFAPCYDFEWQFNAFDPASLPFPSEPLWFSRKTHNRRDLPARIRKAVDSWRPDAVFIGFGRWLKPYVIEALAHYPIVSRYYMYEHLCMRDFCLYRNDAPCLNDIFETPDACRRCALECWDAQIATGKHTVYSHEFLLAKAHTRAWRELFTRAMRKVRVAIVNNETARARLDGHCRDVRVMPGGVDLDTCGPPPDRSERLGKAVIAMTGRTDDIRKGLDVIIEAGAGLHGVRDDFEVWVTSPHETEDMPWLRNAGWRDHTGIQRLYEEADVCVVPSLWEEPFGLVAVEAMAAGLPVVASRVGGLQHIVRHGETGYLFGPGLSGELALRLAQLLDDPGLRRRMGTAGRRLVETEYNWTAIAERHYPPLLEELAR